jgi:hypothetical protein
MTTKGAKKSKLSFSWPPLQKRPRNPENSTFLTDKVEIDF